MTDASVQTASPAGSRQAGLAQGIVLIILASMPTMAIVTLVPNLPQLFKRFHDVPGSDFLVPMIITLPSLCIAIFSPLAGALADFWGRRPLLILSTFVYALVGVLPFLLSDLYAILAARFAIGVAEAGILSCQNALMGDYFEGKKRQYWLGMMSFFGPIIATGLVLAGGQLGSWDWRGPFLLYLLGLPVALWVALAVFEPQAKQEEHRGDAPTTFPWAAARLVAVVTIAVAVVYFVQAVQLGRMFSDHGIDSPAQISFYVTVASCGVFIGGFVFSRLTNVRTSTRFVLVLLSMGIGYAGLGLAPTAAAAIPFGIVAQFGNGLTLPTLIGWALTKFEFQNRGRGMGIWSGCFFIGTFLSPPFVTLVGKAAGSFLQTVSVIGMACVVVALAVWFLGRRATPSPARSQPST